MAGNVDKPPKSSSAEKANLIVAAYAAKQARATALAAAESARSNRAIEQNTRAMMQSNQAIAQNTSQMVEIGKKMELAQANAAKLLESVDFGVRNLEQITKDTNDKLKRSNDIAEQNLLQNTLANERAEWRDQRDRLEKQIEEEERAYEQSLKDILHRFSRRVQLLGESGMTRLELYFFTKQMLETVEGISADLLKDITDKQYRDEVEDQLREAISSFYEEMDEQDLSDLSVVAQIEKTDENEKASKLLDSLQKKLDR